MPELRVFDFERDLAGVLPCIPMAVRYKLDLVAVKLSLRQWRRLTRIDRCELLYRSCDSRSTISAYRDYLCDLIRTRAQEEPVASPPEDRDEWRRFDAVPDRICRYAESRGLPIPSLEAWRALEMLQRFALWKLTRAGHDNDNFEPAMREFGLVAS